MATVKTSTKEPKIATSATRPDAAVDSSTSPSDADTSRRTPTSTFVTSTPTSELITAAPSTGIASTIEWGPAITATSLVPAETDTPSATNEQPERGMSRGGRTALISTTTIGGTLILAFLIYALWRRRKGATYSDIIHFRPHSGTLILSPGPRHPDFTALPIYRESRFSVQSTKRGSWLSFSKLTQRRAPSPSSEAFSRGPWLHAQWKKGHPPTPTRAGHPLSQVEAVSTPSIRSPEMAHTRATSHTERIHIKRSASESTISKPSTTISTREVPSSSGPRDLEAESPPGSPSSNMQLQDDSRWSWTNSQAPATPRMRTRSPTRRPSRASTGSLPSFKIVHSWLKPQREREADRIPEEQAPRPVAKPKLPPLKNKASKPVLAPITTKPTRRLSKKSGPPSAALNRSRTRSVSAREGEANSIPETASFSLPLQRN